MEDKYIVSIDFGTFKIAVAVACVSGDDTRIVYYKESPVSGMRSSRILNENKVAQTLKKAVADAEDILGIKITGAVVGMPRFYVSMEENSARIEREPDSFISAEEIEDLKSFAQDSYPLEDPEHDAVYGAIAQSFSTEEEFQVIEDDAVGMSGKSLEGNFKVFIGNRSSLGKIDRVMKAAGLVALKKYFTPQLTADSTLFSSETDNGVALIDFGGGCTSLSIYYKNILRYYASIPFGGCNVTKDIQTESSIRNSLAESIKLAYGACLPEKLQNLGEKQLLIKSGNGDADKRLSVKYLSEIITAREEEIMDAMLYEIGRSGFAEKIQSGIVITGGGAQMANLANLITDMSGYAVRIGRPVFKGIYNCCTGLNSPAATTTVGLLKAARELPASCAFSKDSLDNAPAEDTQEKKTEERPEEAGMPTDDEHKTGTLPGMGGTDTEIKEAGKKKPRNKGNKINALWRNMKKMCQDIEEGIGNSTDSFLNLRDDN